LLWRLCRWRPAVVEPAARIVGLSLIYFSDENQYLCGRKEFVERTFLRPKVLSTAALFAAFGCSFFFGGMFPLLRIMKVRQLPPMIKFAPHSCPDTFEIFSI